MSEPLRILVVHGRYRSAGPSGENEVVDDEIKLLREHGCTVEQCELESDDIAGWSAWKRALLPGRVIWSQAIASGVTDDSGRATLTAAGKPGACVGSSGGPSLSATTCARAG